MPKLDAKDHQIIRELQKDGRLTNQELADKVNLSPSPCLRRLRNLEKSGVIEGYTALVNQKAYGLPISVFVRVRLNLHTQEAVATFETAINRLDAVLDCYLMTGNSDYLLRVLMGSLEEYEMFIREKIHKIPGVAEIDSGFAFGLVKQTKIFPAMR